MAPGHRFEPLGEHIKSTSAPLPQSSGGLYTWQTDKADIKDGNFVSYQQEVMRTPLGQIENRPFRPSSTIKSNVPVAVISLVESEVPSSMVSLATGDSTCTLQSHNFEIFEDATNLQQDKAAKGQRPLYADMGCASSSATESPATNWSPLGWSPNCASPFRQQAEQDPIEYIALTYFDQLPAGFVEEMKAKVEATEQLQHQTAQQARLIRRLLKENSRLRSLPRQCDDAVQAPKSQPCPAAPNGNASLGSAMRADCRSAPDLYVASSLEDSAEDIPCPPPPSPMPSSASSNLPTLLESDIASPFSQTSPSQAASADGSAVKDDSTPEGQSTSPGSSSSAALTSSTDEEVRQQISPPALRCCDTSSTAPDLKDDNLATHSGSHQAASLDASSSVPAANIITDSPIKPIATETCSTPPPPLIPASLLWRNLPCATTEDAIEPAMQLFGSPSWSPESPVEPAPTPVSDIGTQYFPASSSEPLEPSVRSYGSSWSLLARAFCEIEEQGAQTSCGHDGRMKGTSAYPTPAAELRPRLCAASASEPDVELHASQVPLSPTSSVECEPYVPSLAAAATKLRHDGSRSLHSLISAASVFSLEGGVPRSSTDRSSAALESQPHYSSQSQLMLLSTSSLPSMEIGHWPASSSNHNAEEIGTPLPMTDDHCAAQSSSYAPMEKVRSCGMRSSWSDEVPTADSDPDPGELLQKLKAHRTLTEKHRANLQELIVQAADFSSNMQLVHKELQESRASCQGMILKIEAAMVGDA